MQGEYTSANLVHRLPRAKLVDRCDFIVQRCQDRRIIDVGFTDQGFRSEHQRRGSWLHARVASVAREAVGVDIDAAGVEAASAAGYEAVLADCVDTTALAALGLKPADVVVAGEVIEHIASPGKFLENLRMLCHSKGHLILTTPNATGLVNTAAGFLRNVEVNHPDHVVAFTWYTLSELLRRCGWNPIETAVYTPPGAGTRSDHHSTLERLGVTAVLKTEQILARLGRPFCADGLIIISEPAVAA